MNCGFLENTPALEVTGWTCWISLTLLPGLTPQAAWRVCTDFFWKTLDTFHCVSVIPSMQISYVCSALACFTTLNSSIYASFLRAPLATVDLLLCRCHLPSANGMWSHQAAGWLPHPTCVTQAHRAICSSNWWEFREIREWFYLFTPFPSTHPSLLPSILQNGELLPNQLWQGAQSPLTVYHKRDLRCSTITACT